MLEKRHLCMIKAKQTHAQDTCLLLTTLNSLHWGLFILLYDSTGVLGMDDKKIHTVK